MTSLDSPRVQAEFSSRGRFAALSLDIGEGIGHRSMKRRADSEALRAQSDLNVEMKTMGVGEDKRTEW